MTTHTTTRQLAIATFLAIFATVAGSQARAAGPTISIETKLAPPGWALLEREVLKQNYAACREFFDKYFDERGWLLCVERWGGDDGPDDAIESTTASPAQKVLVEELAAGGV